MPPEVYLILTKASSYLFRVASRIGGRWGSNDDGGSGDQHGEGTFQPIV